MRRQMLRHPRAEWDTGLMMALYIALTLLLMLIGARALGVPF